MNFRALQHTHLLAAVVFITAILVLTVQLITPSPVMVSIGDNGAQTMSVGEYFTFRQVALVMVAAFVCGVSGTYLLFHNQAYVLASNGRATTPARGQPRFETGGGVVTPSRQPTRTMADTRSDEERWEETLERLSNNQETVYRLLIEASGELPQREVVEETDLSKATVSRTLDKLEHRELVERRRSGMGNTIRLR